MVGTRASTRRSAGEELANEASKPVISQRGGRGTRQTRLRSAARETEASPASSTKQTRQPSHLQGVRKPARRSARRFADARSVASVPTHASGSDESDDDVGEQDYSEDDIEEEMAVQIEVEPSASEESSPFLSGTLDAGVMLELRTSFYDAINALYRYLCLEDRDQVWESCLDTYREVFKTFRARYSSERTVFLDRAPIEEALASQGLEVVPSVSHIISAANLVILMDAIHQVAVGNEEAVYLFHEIDEDFPHCIMTWDSVTENTHDDYRTSERALDIRISLWILQIAASQAVTEQAAMELGATLLFGTAPGFTMYPHEMDSETVEFRPIYGGEFSDPANEDEYLRAMRRDIFRDYTRVCRHITNGGVDLDGLQQAFSIRKSLDELFMWAKNIFKEVVKTIEQESARPVAETSTGSPMPVHQGARSLHRGVSSLQALKEIQNEQVVARESSSRKRTSDGNDPYELPVGDDDADVGVSAPERRMPKKRASRAKPSGTQRTAVGSPVTNNTRPGSEPAVEGDVVSITSSMPVRVQKKKDPQKRIPWNPDDEEVLKELVRCHGSFWSHMEKVVKEEGLLRHERNQTQLRDKARNMKVDILKNDWLLPEGFNTVALGEKEKRTLISAGKNYERREEDVSEGQPINTELWQMPQTPDAG